MLLSMETSFHPQPSLSFLLGVPFFSVGGRVGTGIDDRLEGAGIVEVLSGFSQVQPNDLKIGIPFPGKWKPSKKFSVVRALFCEIRCESLKFVPVTLVDRSIQTSRSVQMQNFLQSCSLRVLFKGRSSFSSVVHSDGSSHL